VTIRFTLPDGIAVDELPVAARPVDAQHVEVRTEDELRVLHDLTGWALAGGHRLVGLSVLRTSLEDVYLGLTRGLESDDGAGAANQPAAGETGRR
jgi:hypothetical protein